MNGIVGIISHSREVPVPEAEINGLVLAYESLRGRGQRHDARAGKFACVAKLSTDDVPGIDQHNASWAASIGLVHHQAPLAETSVEDLDGQFALVAYDARADQVLVVADPVGFRALYVAERDDKTYVSTCALALAKYLEAKPSRLGLYAFLRAGYHFGTSTNWEGIERLDPGTCISFTTAGRQQRTYWRPVVDEHVSRLSFSQTVDYCLEVAVETCRSYLAPLPRTWSDLTGGFDSRLMNLILHKAGVDFRTCTRGVADEQDVELARQVAQAAGWDWEGMTEPQDWDTVMPDLLPVSLAWGDANLEVLHLSHPMWKHEQTSRTAPYLIGGGGGEVFRDFAWRQEFLKAGRSKRVNFDNWIDMRLIRPMNTSILAYDPTADVREDFRERMAAWAEPYASELNTTQLSVMYAYKMTGHFGSYASAAEAFLNNQHPLCYKPLISAAISTDYRYRTNGRLLRYMIERLDPRVASITTTNGTPAESWRITNLHRILPYYVDVGSRTVRKLLEKTSRGRVRSRPESVDPRLAADRRVGLAFIAEADGGTLSYANMRSASLYKQNALDGFLSNASAPGFRDTILLGRILTIELALRATGTGVEEGVPYAAMAH